MPEQRLLNTFKRVEDFLTKELQYELTKENYDIVTKITAIELSLYNFDKNYVTKESPAYRNMFFRNAEDRQALKNKIVHELISLPNIYDDDKITIGYGGAVPEDIKTNKTAYFLIGLPASGKSTVTDMVSKKHGAIVLDADYAKRKLPEFENVPFGATLVHTESNEIIFGNEKSDGFKDSLMDIAIQINANIVIPKIGKSHDDITSIAQILKGYGYNTHLTLVKLDKQKSTQRALARFMESKRYIPLGLIFDDYGNQPTLSFSIMKSEFTQLFDSFGIISTDVPINSPYICSESTHNNNPAKLF